MVRHLRFASSCRAETQVDAKQRPAAKAGVSVPLVLTIASSPKHQREYPVDQMAVVDLARSL
jgi:hypothetical protein